MALHGHVWTVVPHFVSGRADAPASQPWSTTLDDPELGTIRTTGLFIDRTDSTRAVILQHGLGGSAESSYLQDATSTLWRAGYAVLRPSMRGAERSGADLYHAGLTSDLHAALASDALRRFDSVAVVGYSMGGHLALGLARESTDPRLAAVAAVCAPLDLHATGRAIDASRAMVYRHYLLRHLKLAYAEVARQGRHPTALGDVRRVKTLREWDALTVVPRFGFRDVDDYYDRASAGPRLDQTRVPTLIVAARHDPMVPDWTVAPSMRGASSPRIWARRVERGGHVGFPADVDLGFGGGRGLEAQIAGWLALVGH